LSSRIQAIHRGQSAVHDHDSRLQLASQFDGLSAVTGFAHDIHIRFVFQHAPETSPHQAMIVYQQHRNLFCHIHI